jgi:hypothetical protein
MSTTIIPHIAYSEDLDGERRADITLGGRFPRFSVSYNLDDNTYVVLDHDNFGWEWGDFPADDHTLEEIAEMVVQSETEGRN